MQISSTKDKVERIRTAHQNLNMQSAPTRTLEPKPHKIPSLFHLNDRSIRIRLIVCFVLIVLLVMAADAVAVWQFRQISAASERLSNADEMSHAVVRVHLDVDTFRDSMGALASSHNAEQFSNEAASIRRTFLRDVDQAEQALRVTPDVEQNTTLSGALESLRMTLLSQLDTAVQLAAASEWSAIGSRMTTQIPALIDYSSSVVERVDQQALQQRTKAIQDTHQARQSLLIIVPIAALLTLLAAAALGWYVTQTITAPLSELTAGAEALARKDFQNQINVRGDDELALLGEAFNNAARELQQLYEDLRGSEKELRDIIDTVPAMVWTALPDGSNALMNKRWREYTGSPAVSLGYQNAVHPDDRSHHLDVVRASSAAGLPFEDEIRCRRADGEYRWFLVQATPLRDERENIVRWYGILTDIEERKRAGETLREQANLLSLTHDAICVCDMSGVLKYWNRGAQELYGWAAQDVIGTFTHDLLKTIFPAPLSEIVTEVVRTERWEGEVVQTRKDGRQIVVASRWSLQRDQKGSPVGFLETNNDITERKRGEEERERLRQELAHLAHLNRVSTIGELTASLAHELKQPIGAAVTNAEASVRLLARAQPDVLEAREAALEMVKDARRAADIIDRVRLLYQKGSSQLELVDVNEVIEEMVIMLQKEANRHSATIRTDLAEALPKVMADRVQLQQVLMNIMLNGIEAMRDTSGELGIKSQLAEDGQVVISVTDNGVGLPTENTDRIFNAFFTTKSQGTGLGLAITRSIIETHGGRIWASANSGRGTTFFFTLPTAVALST
jgi:PAS domain S-box-containing protein